MLEAEGASRPLDLSEIKELKERWFTKRELHLMAVQQGETSPYLKQAEEGEMVDTKSVGYNVTRVKI